MYHAKLNTLDLGKQDGTESNSLMDYVSYGNGTKNLIMIPGLNLRGVRGATLSLAFMYRIFAKDYKVYIFDRKNNIPKGYSVHDIANDIVQGMKMLGIQQADILGISQGGMIAQNIAIHHPDRVNKLVLGVSASRDNEVIEQTIGSWIDMALKKDYQTLITDMMGKMYSENYLRRYRIILPFLAKTGKPKDEGRFINLARACFTCDTYERLNEIKCPTLVLGGSEDKVVGGEASREMAEKMHCELIMYEGLGHAAYEEAKDFNQRILEFLRKE